MTSALDIVQKALVDTMRLLMPLLRLLTWIRMYRRKAFLDYHPTIMIVSGYTLARKSSTAKPDRSEWVPNSLWEDPRRSSPKESVPDLSDLVVIWDVIVLLWFSAHTVFTEVSSDDPGYKSSLVTMSAQTCTRQICFSVRHWVTVVILTPFLYIRNVGDTFSARYRHPLLCGSSHCFL